MQAITPEPILKIATGFMAAKQLFAASEIGLFEALADGPAGLEELAGKTTVPRRTVGIVAAAMVSLGLIDQEGGRYRNGETAATFLAGKPGHDVRPVLRFFNSISYPLWERLADAVRSGEGQAQFGKFDREQQQIFSGGVEALTAPVAASLAAAYDFSRHKRLLDVGGGTGSFLLAVLRRYPALRGTLFELPGACAVARQRLSAEPEGKRIDIIEGDMFKTPLPAGHDVLLVANTVHVLSALRNLDLMRKMRATVQSGACCWWTSGRIRRTPNPYRRSHVGGISGHGRRGASLQRAGSRPLAGADRLAQTRTHAARGHFQCHRCRSRLGLDCLLGTLVLKEVLTKGIHGNVGYWHIASFRGSAVFRSLSGRSGHEPNL